VVTSSWLSCLRCVLQGAQLLGGVWADHLHGIFRHQLGHQGDTLNFRFTCELQTGLMGQVTWGLSNETLCDMSQLGLHSCMLVSFCVCVCVCVLISKVVTASASHFWLCRNKRRQMAWSMNLTVLAACHTLWFRCRWDGCWWFVFEAWSLTFTDLKPACNGAELILLSLCLSTVCGVLAGNSSALTAQQP
jgi:hypothetical protein